MYNAYIIQCTLYNIHCKTGNTRCGILCTVSKTRTYSVEKEGDKGSARKRGQGKGRERGDKERAEKEGKEEWQRKRGQGKGKERGDTKGRERGGKERVKKEGHRKGRERNYL